MNPDCTDSSDAPSPDVPVPTLVTRCPSTVPEAYLMQSLWLKVKVSAVDHSRILSDYLSACLLLGGRRIKLTQNLGNITRMLCINNRVKEFLETISDFLFVIPYSFVILLVISSICVVSRGYNRWFKQSHTSQVLYVNIWKRHAHQCHCGRQKMGWFLAD